MISLSMAVNKAQRPSLNHYRPLWGRSQRLHVARQKFTVQQTPNVSQCMRDVIIVLIVVMEKMKNRVVCLLAYKVFVGF